MKQADIANQNFWKDQEARKRIEKAKGEIDKILAKYKLTIQPVIQIIDRKGQIDKDNSKPA